MLHCGTSPVAGFLPPAVPKNRVSTVLLRSTGESQRGSPWGGASVAASRQVSSCIGACAFGTLVIFVSKREEAGAKVQPVPSLKNT